MTLEATLVRIAEALERLTAAPPVVGDIGIPEATKGMTVVEAPKRARGRPAKITAEAKDTATPAEVVPEAKLSDAVTAGGSKKFELAVPVDDFLNADIKPAITAKPLTIEDVRGALQVYARKNGDGPGGTARARQLMSGASSNGALRLSVVPNVVGGDQGVLLPADYAAVIKAALA